MAFELTRFGSNSSNIKSILGGVNDYRYYNKDGNTLTTPGYFPSNLGLEVGDRIRVVPKVKTDADEIYVVSSTTDGVVTVTQIDTDGAVDSVNGKTGDVVLDAEDVGAVTMQTQTVTLASTDWVSHAQTKSVSGVTADNTVILSPAPASAAEYAQCEIYCTAQGNGTLTFECTTDPTNNVSVTVVILN